MGKLLAFNFKTRGPALYPQRIHSHQFIVLVVNDSTDWEIHGSDTPHLTNSMRCCAWTWTLS